MRILVGSDSPYIPSGFARQLHGVAEHLAYKGHEVSYLAWQTRGDFQINDYPYNIIGSMSPFGKNDWISAFTKTQPDVVISLGDAHMVDVLGRMQRPLWIMYYPLDGDPISPLIEQVIRSADVPMAMANYGKTLTETQLGIKPQYIPHFYRPEEFFELDNKTELRKKYGIPEDAFVIGSLSRLNPRKHHQRLLYAFRKLLDNNPDQNLILYLHLDPRDPIMFNDPNHNYQFIELIDTMGLNDNVMITPENNYHQGVPVENLNEILNCFDVHTIATGGEGFGVPFLESAATGTPTVATNYTTTAEHLMAVDPYSKDFHTDIDKMRGIPVKHSKLYMELAQVQKAWIDIDSYVKAFQMYLDKPELLKKHGENAKEYVEMWYTYDVIMDRWDELLSKMYTNIRLVDYMSGRSSK